MAGYLAKSIIEGRTTYTVVFINTKLYAKWRADVDTILELEGYGSLIIK